MSRIIAIAASCTLLMLGAAPPESADFIYSGNDDTQAGRIMMKSLEAVSRDWKTEWLSQQNGAFILNRKNDPDVGFKPTLIVQVKTMSKGLDRVIFAAVFPGRPDNSQDLKALQFLNRLNDSLTGLSFSYKDTGVVVAEAYHDFRNVVTGRDLEELLKDFDGAMNAVLEDQELRDQFMRFVSTEDRSSERDA